MPATLDEEALIEDPASTLTHKDLLALDVAHLHHEGDLTQAEVAKKVQLSRPTVSKLLTHALSARPLPLPVPLVATSAIAAAPPSSPNSSECARKYGVSPYARAQTDEFEAR